MNKSNAVSVIKSVMEGASGHTNGVIYKVGRSWKVETGMNYIEKDGYHFQHCCNNITRKEVEKIISIKY